MLHDQTYDGVGNIARKANEVPVLMQAKNPQKCKQLRIERVHREGRQDDRLAGRMIGSS